MALKDANGVMDAKIPDVKAQVHPFERCYFISYLAVSWATPLLKQGAKQALSLSDVCELPSYFRAMPLGARFSAAFGKYQSKRVVKACFRAFGGYWVRGLMFIPVTISSNGFMPLALKSMIRFINDESRYLKDPFLGIESGWVLVAIVAACSVGLTVGMTGVMLHNILFGCCCRTAIMEALYQKVLRLSEGALQQSSLGQIVTLVSADLERLYFGAMLQTMIIQAPMAITICIILLILEVGVLPTLAGLAVLVLVLPLNICAANRLRKHKSRMLELTDERVRFMSEILGGIRIVKLHSWEGSVEEHIQSLRVQETRENTRAVLLQAFTASTGYAMPAFIPFAIFATYAAMGNQLTVEKVFAVLAMMNVIRMPMQILPKAVSGVTQALVSAQRIERFLSIPERSVGWEAIQDGQIEATVDVNLQKASCTWGGQAEREAIRDLARNAPQKGKGKGKAKGLAAAETSSTDGSKGKGGKGKGTDNFKGGKNGNDASAADGSKGNGGKGKGIVESAKDQTDASNRIVLDEVTLVVPHGQKVAIVGRVAAGKSSLLSGMLGELDIRSGSVARGSPIVPYCSQAPWIQSATLKGNILFGLPEDPELFQRAVEAAQLKPDLLILPHGEQTYIGENGINLSGGQKARTALARAFYASLNGKSPMVLLDDPIAAVDAFVAHELFRKAFLGLLKEQTVILTLNAHLDLLSSFDRVIALENGRMAVDGTLEDVMNALPWVRDAVGSSQTKQEDEIGNDIAKSVEDKAPVDGGRASAVDLPKKDVDQKAEKAARPLYEPEDRVEGRVQLQNYIEWARCAISDGGESKWPGLVLLIVLLFSFAAAQAMRLTLDVWCARWADNDDDLAYAIGMYGILAAVFLVCTVLRAVIFFLIAMRSCRSLHLMVLHKVMMAPVNLFFDVTPTGRILNRFSSDLEKVDDKLPEQLFMFLQLGFVVTASLVTCMTSSPFVVIGIPFLALLFLKIVSFYQKSAREIKRLDSISRSPLLQHFSESIKGLATIRAYHAGPRFLQRYRNLVDSHAKCFFTFWLSSRWLGIRVDLVAATLQCMVAIISMAWKDNADPVLVGMALVWGFQLSGALQMCVRSFAEVENTMTGVERLVAYKHVPQEAEYVLEPRPVKDWPAGEIEIRDVTARYRPGLPLVLKNVSLHIFPGERVGMCGRTGSGKSTMGLVLFRMIETEGGQVLIDGRDTKTIGLQDLRQRMAMIPQDPVLFRMTVRQNIDPFQMYTNEQIWKVLELVCLDEEIRGLAGDLSFLCAEGGTNFSQGQMQLLCIARTLLQVPSIVMMDEATANIDALSDEIIQRTIRSHFNNVTVLTIAHRLSTIADSTKIAVFDKGELCEYGTPQELVAQGGALAAFFREAGINLSLSSDMELESI